MEAQEVGHVPQSVQRRGMSVIAKAEYNRDTRTLVVSVCMVSDTARLASVKINRGGCSSDGRVCRCDVEVVSQDDGERESIVRDEEARDQAYDHVVVVDPNQDPRQNKLVLTVCDVVTI